MKNASLMKVVFSSLTLLAALTFNNAHAKSDLTPEDARAIAKEAYIYGFPLADSYRILYASFINEKDPDFKTPWNRLRNLSRVYTHEDRAVQSPNSDTPYSWLGLDLRAEPFVLTVPKIEKQRYYSIQLIDLYTHNFAYIGSRATGNDGGNYLIAGPNWKGKQPKGIDKVIRAETDMVIAIYRTQLFNPDDMKNVKAIQSKFMSQPLSAFLGQPAPKAAPTTKFIKPLTRDELTKSPKIFQQINFVLNFCPMHPSEKPLMARFAKIDIGAGKHFDFSQFDPAIQQAIGQGIADAWQDFDKLKQRAAAGEVGSAEVFGTREHLKNNYLYRMAGAVLGIWGNSAAEAIYPTYLVDADGQKLDGSHRYTIRFAKDQFPPVNSFWSLTMYELPASLLVANSLNRYLLNSSMINDFVRDADGGITLYIQHESPGKDKETNWLPAPKGAFIVTMRLYWPKPEALDGSWKLPKLKRM